MIDDKHDYPCNACHQEDILCEPITIPELKRPCDHCRQTRLECSYRENGGRGVTACDACAADHTECIAGPLQEHLEHRYAHGKTYTPRTKEKVLGDASPVAIKQDPAVVEELLPFLKVPARPIRDPMSRMFVMCNQCRQEGLRCNLSRGEPGPCRPCKRVGEECEFVWPVVPHNHSSTICIDQNTSAEKYTQHLLGERLSRKTFTTKKGNQSRLERTAKDAAKKARKAARSSKMQVEARPPHPGPGETKGIKHIYIKTSFCHPIKFNYQPDPDNKYPCSWCLSPVFGLFGLGVKEVEVVPFNIGYEEIRGGHYDDGQECSKMCVVCTFKRLSTIACRSHLMKPLKIVEEDTLNMEKLEKSFRALVAHDEEGGALAKKTIWCTICITPAEYVCCAGRAGSGCGLHLCQGCNDLHDRLLKSSTDLSKTRVLDVLVNLWKEDQWKMGAGAEEEGSDWRYDDDRGELRADAEFLLSTGELFIRTSKSMRMTTHNCDPIQEAYQALRQADREAMSSRRGRGNLANSRAKSATNGHISGVRQDSTSAIKASLPAKPISTNGKSDQLVPVARQPAIVSRALAAGMDSSTLSAPGRTASVPNIPGSTSLSRLMSSARPLQQTPKGTPSSSTTPLQNIVQTSQSAALNPPLLAGNPRPSALIPQSRALPPTQLTPTQPALHSKPSPPTLPSPTQMSVPRASSARSPEPSPPKATIKSIFGPSAPKPSPSSSLSVNPPKSIRERLQERKQSQFQRTTLFTPSRPHPHSLSHNSSMRSAASIMAGFGDKVTISSKDMSPRNKIQATTRTNLVTAPRNWEKGAGNKVFIDLTNIEDEDK